MKNLFHYIQQLTVAYTHATVFHADEVFSSALIKVINPSIRIIRTMDPSIKDAFYFDFANGEYDHHQEGAAERPDGTKYCAFGLLWRDLGHEVINTITNGVSFDDIDRFVYKIDESDTSCKRNPISNAISSFNPTWDEDADDDARDDAFNKAVDVATEILKTYLHLSADIFKVFELIKNRTLASEGALQRAADFVSKADHSINGVVIMDKYAPFNHLDNQMVKFYIYPSLRGGWNVHTPSLKAADGSTHNAASIAADDQLRKKLKINFIHNSGFLANVANKEDAIELAKINL